MLEAVTLAAPDWLVRWLMASEVSLAEVPALPRREALIRAAALLTAEVDRMDLASRPAAG